MCVVFVGVLVSVSLYIRNEVEQECRVARARYGGDCVDAMSKLLQDENRSFRDRNDAIWVLGQLGDERALPALNRYYTGVIPEREPINGMISQYELKKAIKLAEGGFNITHWF
jgi:hypothetical protein